MYFESFAISYKHCIQFELLPSIYQKLLEILQTCGHMAIIIIMKQNISNKRRAFQNEIRSQQIESILKTLRKQAFGQPNNNINHLSLDQIINSLPLSLPHLFDFMKANQNQSCMITDFLIRELPTWINRCAHQVMDIQLWSFLMEILIKMFENCQNSFQKQLIMNHSQEIVINIGVRLSQQNKTLKYGIFLMILDYYLVGFTNLDSCKRSKNYIKMLFHQLQTLNWKTKDKQLLKFIFFCNSILDLCIAQDDKQFIFELFLQKDTIYIHLMSIIQQIYTQSRQRQQQNLLALILISLINFTFSLSDRKIYKIIIATDFQLFLGNRITDIQNQPFLVQFYLQLMRNLMLDHTQFRMFIKNNAGYLLNYKQVPSVLWYQLRQLCYE